MCARPLGVCTEETLGAGAALLVPVINHISPLSSSSHLADACLVTSTGMEFHFTTVTYSPV